MGGSSGSGAWQQHPQMADARDLLTVGGSGGSGRRTAAEERARLAEEERRRKNQQVLHQQQQNNPPSIWNQIKNGNLSFIFNSQFFIVSYFPLIVKMDVLF